MNNHILTGILLGIVSMILFSGLSLDVEAQKGKGVFLPNINSNLVCGDKLCSEVDNYNLEDFSDDTSRASDDFFDESSYPNTQTYSPRAGNTTGYNTGSAAPTQGYNTGSAAPTQGYNTGSAAPTQGYNTGSAAPTQGYNTGSAAPTQGYNTGSAAPTQGYNTGSAAPTQGYNTGSAAPTQGYNTGSAAPTQGYNTGSAAPTQGYNTGSAAPTQGYNTGTQNESQQMGSSQTTNPSDYGYSTGSTKPNSQASTIITKDVSAKAKPIYEDMKRFVTYKTSINNEQSSFISLISYSVFDGKITPENKPNVPPDLVKITTDTKKHQELWDAVEPIIPADYKFKVAKFQLATDDKDGAISQIIREGKELDRWSLKLDPVDFYPRNYLEQKGLAYITIHQVGQMITRDSSQIDLDEKLWDLGRMSSEAYDTSYLPKKAECGTKLMLWDGCSKNDSYLNKFYQRFWSSIYSEWALIDKMQESEKTEKLQEFAKKYSDRFVTDYAATSLQNDIAESWAAFVLLDNPTGGTVSDQKIKFFYEFGELIKIRDEIRNAL